METGTVLIGIGIGLALAGTAGHAALRVWLRGYRERAREEEKGR